MEKSEITVGYGNTELLAALTVKKERQPSFILNELNKLDKWPGVKDYFFKGLGIQLDIRPKNKSFSRAYNRTPGREMIFHTAIMRKFDHRLLLDTKLPVPVSLMVIRKEEYIYDQKFHDIKGPGNRSGNLYV